MNTLDPSFKLVMTMGNIKRPARKVCGYSMEKSLTSTMISTRTCYNAKGLNQVRVELKGRLTQSDVGE